MTTDTLLAAATGDIQAAIDAGRLTGQPHQLETGGYYVMALPGRVERIDLTGDQHRDNPRRKTGTVHVADVDSFAAYHAKHADDASEIYADRARRTVTAVLDAHHPTGGDARFGEHRLIYTAAFSEAWKAWAGGDGRAMDQATFAEFIEDNRADIHNPAAAQMLEIAQTLEGTNKATWSAGVKLANGQRKLMWVEETNATAGERGDLKIPTELVLRLPIFDRATHAHEVTARFRYRLNSGKLALLYKLDRPADLVTAAFESVIDQIAEATKATVLRGTPAGS